MKRILRLLNNLKISPSEEKKISSLPYNAIEIITIAVFSLELIALPNLFSGNQARRLRDISIEIFATTKESNKEKISKEIEDYEMRFKEHGNAGLNPLWGIEELLMKKLEIEDLQPKNFPGVKLPDPILGLGFSIALVPLLGRWKIFKENLKIVKD